jgi:hypothetical protein
MTEERPLSPQETITRLVRAPFRAAVVVLLTAFVFAARNGMAADDLVIDAVFLGAVVGGALAAGLVDARPRAVGVIVSAVSASGCALLLLGASLEAREYWAGPLAAERLGDALPWLGLGGFALALAAAAAGATARAWLEGRRSG